MSDLSGHTLGNYQLEALLGAGGTGAVYRLHMQGNVAIKVLHDHIARNPTFQARFRQEAETLVKLRHRHIVEAIDFGEQDGRYYLVMELITAGSVRTLIQRFASARQLVPLPLSLTLMHQAAEALAFAHEQGIIHRDLKPDNLLLAPRSTSDTYDLKIADFGLARLLEADGMTITGVTMGTPAYISPEQCLGNEVNGRSDLYSLGIVLYELTTGYLPFKINSLPEAVQKHVNEKPRPPREVRPDLPQALVDLIGRCLEKDPQKRIASAQEFAKALEPMLPDLTIITERSGEEEHLEPLPRIGIKLERDTESLTPGQPTAIRVTLANLGKITDRFTVTVEGVPETWVKGLREPVKLNPGDKETVPCTVQPPRSPESRAGEYPVVIRALSGVNPKESETVQAQWTVLP